VPNTLVHLGIQGLGSRVISEKVDLKWVFLGCIIPDLPWIWRHVIMNLDTVIDPYDLRLFTLVQASLLFCLLLSMAFALLSKKPRLVFVILAVNSLVHLLLDAVEIKWGNGVHLFAPLDWHLLNFGLIWPDSLPVTILSIMGLLFCIWVLANPPSRPIHLLPGNSLRLFSALALVSVYSVAPIALMNGPYSTDANSIATLKERDSRIGKEILMDRETYLRGEEKDTVITFAGERLDIISELRASDDSRVSLIGEFVDHDVIRIQHFHEHKSLWRDFASYIGLFVVALTWVIAFVHQRQKR
jgi:hypothetical protein